MDQPFGFWNTALPSEMWLQNHGENGWKYLSSRFGKSAAALGDINGDGYGDLAIGPKRRI